LPSDSPGVGSLASKLYDKDTTQIDGVSYSGTVSTLKITGLDLFSGDEVPKNEVLKNPTWKVLLRSYGLACTGGSCGIKEGEPASVKVEEKNKPLGIVGRLSVQGDSDAVLDPDPDAVVDPNQKIGLALYAGVDLTDTRVISGYAYDAPDQSTFKLSAPASLEFGFDPGFQKGGGRLERLQFYSPNADKIVRVDLGNEIGVYDAVAKGDFKPGPVARQFLNDNDYAKELRPPDGGMYWFFNGDGGGNNSISVAATTSLPMTIVPPPPPTCKINCNGGGGNTGVGNGGGGNTGVGNGGGGNSQVQPRQDLRPTQNAYIFDNTLFVIDQNVSEDYESASSTSSSKSDLLTVNLAPARSVPKGRCGSGSNQAECKPVSKP
jgi:hypothetical protein